MNAPHEPRVAYFTMEIHLRDDWPTYSGGLGVLAGDTIRAAADCGIPILAVSLVHRKGYFHQELRADGTQLSSPEEWDPSRHLEPLQARVTVELAGREVQVRAWRHEVAGNTPVDVFLLDTDLEENAVPDRRITDSLYGGDERLRLLQEAVLGIGGVRMLRALGYRRIETFHMNEGHAALLTWELADESIRSRGDSTCEGADLDAVRRSCVFTTHTPVPAGHDQFPLELVRDVLRHHPQLDLTDEHCIDVRNAVFGLHAHEAELVEHAPPGTRLNMTWLALTMSSYVNGVAKSHSEVSRRMFDGRRIDAITNGVHAETWTAPSMAAVFDAFLPGWREDASGLRNALSIPAEQIRVAHDQSKRVLLEEVRRRTGVFLDHTKLTLGFARRATAYKRPDLLFEDLERLRILAAEANGLQLVFAGKAHPADVEGQASIHRIFEAAHALAGEVAVVYLENYDTGLAHKLVAGVDVWLNNPEPPKEASGTSGMKAALNGVPSLSVLDGWWMEGCIEGVTGWSIGETSRSLGRAADAEALYRKLATAVIPTWLQDGARWVDIQRHAIAINGSYFQTHRMVQQYAVRAWFR